MSKSTCIHVGTLPLLIVLSILPTLAEADPTTLDSERVAVEAARGAGLGTGVLQADIYTKAGELDGCGWNFTYLLLDHTYRKGQPSALVGSIAMFHHPGKALTLTFKLKGKDYSASRELKLQQADFAIPFAYVESAPGVGSAEHYVATFECEGGGFCGMFDDNIPEVLESFIAGELTFAYQRRKNGLDVRFKVDPTQPPEGEAELAKGLACFKRLFKILANDAK